MIVIGPFLLVEVTVHEDRGRLRGMRVVLQLGTVVLELVSRQADADHWT